MAGSRPQAVGRTRPISAQIKPRNTIITRTNSADGLHVTSARLVSTDLCIMLQVYSYLFDCS